MKREHVFVAAALGVGLLYWLVDATVEYVAFQEEAFWGVLVADLPAHEIYDRSAALVAFLLFGVVLSSFLGRQRRAEEALRQSEERLRRTVETMAEGVVVVDGNGMIVQTNPAAEQILGLPLRAVEQRHYTSPDFEMLRPDGTPMPPEEMAGPRAFREGRTVRNVVMGAKRPDGSLRWIDVSAAPLMTEEGTAEGVVGTFADVTEHKEAEEALRQSEERLRTVFAAAKNVAFVTTDLGGGEARILDFSPGAEAIFGYRREDVIGRPLAILHTPEQVEHFPTVTETIRRHKTGLTAELELVRKSGECFPAILTTFPIFDDGGSLVKILGVSIDISERKEAEEALRQSEEQYRSLVNSLGVGICRTAPHLEGQFLQANPALARMYGCESVHELLDKPVSSFYWDAEERAAVLNELRRSGSVTGRELKFRCKDGTPFWASVTATVHHSPEGEVRWIDSLIANITQRKDAEEALRNSEREKAAILDSLSQLLVYQDAEGKILWANRAAVESAGLSPEGVVGRHCYEAWHGRDSRCPGCPVDRAVQTGQPEHAEISSPDGRTWQIRGDPVRDDDGHIVGIIEATLDITERIRAERALRESEVRYRTLFEQAVDSIVVADVETGAVIDFNDRAHQNLGYTAQEFAEITIPDLEVIESAEEVRSHLQRIVKNGSDSFETKHRTKDGQIRDVHVSSRAVSIGQKSVCQSVWRDITERKRAEQALRESEERYRCLFERAPIGIGLSDRHGRLAATNAAMEAVMGYSASEAKHVNLQDTYVDPDDREALREAMERTGSVAGFPVQLKRKDGTPYDALLYVSKVRLGDQELFQTMCMDVTDHNRLEEELRREEEALERAVRLESLGKLAGGIAHDFNNLMTGIIGYSKLLLDDLPAADPHRGDVEEIGNAARRAAALTQQLLAFSRRRVLAPKAIDLNDVVSGMSSLLERVIGEDVELVTALHPGLGLVRADPSQFEEVLMNLAVNARDAMPEGGTLSIETSDADLARGCVETTPRMPVSQYVMLTVTDTGCGMDEDTLEHLFEPFFTTKGPGEGTGLGLATAYGIVKQHGGYIWAESAPGKGTTFQIYLPRFTGEAETPEAETPTREPQAGGDIILVVEDEESVRRLVHRVLSDNGYTVLTVGSADEADRVMAQHGDEIALLLTDVVLPDRRGPELRAELAEERPTLKALYMSGYAGDRLAQRRTLESGVPFLAKPFSPEKLLQAVRQALNQL